MGLISGIYSKSPVDNLHTNLMDMLNSQRHRDVSNQMCYQDRMIAFGMVNFHNDLFCDLKKSEKPENIIISNKSKIYAFVDGIVLDVLRHKIDLEGMGCKIPIPTCSAIIEAAYEKWGLDFMNHLEGEFACAIWDDIKKKLILVRDPYGHKPLHYYDDNERFIFSSEIKGILKAGILREIDLVSLSDFLSLNCIPCPATIFKNVFQVPPGTMMIIGDNGMQSRKYWDPKLSVDTSITFEDAITQVSSRLYDAVKKRMVSDDIYCFLSGGIDSSAIVSFAAEISDKKVHAVSVGFAEAEANELEDAAVMAKHVGAELHQVIATPDSFFDMLETMIYHHDSPFTDTSAYPTYYAAKLARQFTDVILTGDGPDQTMGGSSHHVFAIKDNTFAKRSTLLQNINKLGSKVTGFMVNNPTPSFFSKIQRKLYRDSLTPVHAAYDVRSYFPDLVKKYLCSDDLWNVHLNSNPYRHPDSWFKDVEGIGDINKYLYADIIFYIPDDLMIKVDRMSMANGLETLSPFQDIGLAEIVNKLPGHFKINQSNNNDISTKYILKKVCESRFPEHTLKKRKQGFGIPAEKWLKQENGSYIKEVLLDKKTLQRGYFEKKSLQKTVGTFLSNKGDYFFPNPSTIVALLTLELWHRRYLD